MHTATPYVVAGAIVVGGVALFSYAVADSGAAAQPGVRSANAQPEWVEPTLAYKPAAPAPVDTVSREEQEIRDRIMAGRSGVQQTPKEPKKKHSPRSGSQKSQSPECTEGYEPCLPPAYDYDCSGGSGNGPAYTGTVRVFGWDVYGLDRDGDGIGCE